MIVPDRPPPGQVRASYRRFERVAYGQTNWYNGPMEEYVQVSTTTGARHDAQRIATELVERRLAGCVQITGPVESVYRWKDQIESTEEWLCLAKTTVEQLTAIDALITELHPYETPELIVTPIIGGSEAYLQWLASELGDTQ